jgi:hypothetical protein
VGDCEEHSGARVGQGARCGRDERESETRTGLLGRDL